MQKEFDIVIPESDRRWAQEFFREHGIQDSEIVICIFPGSKRKSRLWWEERFALIADRLAQEKRARIVLIGAERERDLIRNIAKLMKSESVAAIGQDILKTAAIIASSSMMISIDSGPMHIAAALGVPVIALFGPGNPVRVGPYEKEAAVIYHRLPCSPCYDYQCRYGTRQCMDLIAVEEVIAAIEDNWQRWAIPQRRMFLDKPSAETTPR